ncbi:MAG: hypothetical protein FJ387_17270 [Verrucomicrobia bacterium]|nr:hypothetical protein [Verrucomicrobiota bacterium]
MSGRSFGSQRFRIHDVPGMRTTVCGKNFRTVWDGVLIKPLGPSHWSAPAQACQNLLQARRRL